MNINRGLPPHIVEVILSKLHILNLPTCRLVCKSWNNLILDYASTTKFLPNTFILCTREINHHPLLSFPISPLCMRKPKIHCVDFDPNHLEGMSFSASFRFEDSCSSNLTIVNSCNGLFFVFKLVNGTDCAGILNPMTNEFIQLPPTDTRCHVYHYGFGFSHKTKCYKIARVSMDVENCLGSCFEIFTFGGSNQWSCVDILPFVDIFTCGVYFNGALYWIGMDYKEVHYGNKVIYRLDVENEKIEETNSLLQVGPYSRASIGVLNDTLYATFFSSLDSPCKIEVWMLRNFPGKESWSKEFVINDIPKDWVLPLPQQTVYFEMIKVYDDGEILCLVNKVRFFLYNPKTARIKTLNQIEPMKIKTSNPIDPNIRLFVWSFKIESLNFSSLQTILTGDDC